MAFKLSKLGGFSVATGSQYRGTLAASLVPCVDHIRDLYTQFGVRPYQVRLVHTRWSGGRRGQGVEQVVSVVPVLPTPKVETIESLDRTVNQTGVDEYGQVTVSQISGRYTEDQLLGRNPDTGKIDQDLNFYWEIEFPGRTSNVRIKRRFFPASAPELRAGGFNWVISLGRQSEDRTRDGEPQG